MSFIIEKHVCDHCRPTPHEVTYPLFPEAFVPGGSFWEWRQDAHHTELQRKVVEHVVRVSKESEKPCVHIPVYGADDDVYLCRDCLLKMAASLEAA